MPKKQIMIVRRPAKRAGQPLRPKNQRLLELLKRWEHRVLTPEEEAILDDMLEERARRRRPSGCDTKARVAAGRGADQEGTRMLRQSGEERESVMVEEPERGTPEALREARETLRRLPGGFEPGELEELLAEVKEGREHGDAVSAGHEPRRSSARP